MSWTKLTSSSVSSPGGVSVRIAPLKKSEPEPRLQIRVNSAVSLDVRLTSENSGRADVFLGSGAEAGRMKVISAKDGQFRCRRSGKSGGVLLVVDPPPGAPAEWQITKIGCGDVIVDGVDGVDFKLPWHRRAADRVVEEGDDGALRLKEKAPKTVSDFVAECERLDREYPPTPKTRPMTATEVEAAWERERRGDTPPATLDAIEEDARPMTASECAAMERINADLHKQFDEILADKPINGTARGHVYADSQPAEKITFTHAGKSCLLARNQHAVVTALYRVMTKNGPGHFLGHETLVKVSGASSKEVMQAIVSAARKPIAPLGLKIEPQPGLGYWLKHMEES